MKFFVRSFFVFGCVIGMTLLTLMFNSCNNPDDPTDTSTELSVIEITPDSGPKNTIVKIVGTGFNLVPSNNEVTLNGKVCTVTDAFGEMLTIIIPAGAGSGKIKIETNGKVIFTPVFKYEYTEVNVTTLAGSLPGFKDGMGTEAQFKTPITVAIDTSGNIYVADQGNQKIRKILPSGLVSTFAGSEKGFADGSALSAKFNLPTGIVIDENQNIILTDAFNDKIRKITPQGIVSTIAGSTTGYADGNQDAAKFDVPYGIAIDRDGNYIVSDYLNNRIRKVTPNGVVTTLAGKGNFQNNGGAFADGVGTEAYFYYPTGVAIDDDNRIYIADQFNHRIRSISTSTEVTTIGGSGPVGQFNSGFADGAAETSRFAQPTGICFNRNDSTVVVADAGNHKIRIIKNGEVSTITGDYGYADGASTIARFNGPSGVAIDRDGNIIIADSQNHRIRKIVFE
jgi:sugar lactone lactonase YvrE